MTITGRPPERFCKRGHDTHEAGRVRNGWCAECARLQDAMGGSITGKHKVERSPEWERERVKRWLELVAENPIDQPNGTAARVREIDEIYQRLEADVPTPGARV